MNGWWAALPGAALAGLGAVLSMMGYRQIRAQSTGVGVCVLGAAGAALGALLGYPAFAAGLCAAGAFLGSILPRSLARLTVGLAAALGGSAVGLLLAVISRHSSPLLLCGAAAVGAAVIALLETRILTIGWTSASGAALITLGIVRAIPLLGALPRTQLSVTLGAIFLLLAAGGFAFQWRTAPEEHPTTIQGPSFAASPSA